MRDVLNMKQFIITLAIALPILSFGQYQTRKIGNNEHGLIMEVQKTINGVTLNQKLRLGPSSKQKLLEGIKKAKEWHDLNRERQLSFSKQITQFPVMNLEDYIQHGYSSNLAQTMQMIYYGIGDENSQVKSDSITYLRIGEDPDFIEFLIDYNGYVTEFMEIQTPELTDFQNLIEGKKSSNPIDQIFKN